MLGKVSLLRDGSSVSHSFSFSTFVKIICGVLFEQHFWSSYMWSLQIRGRGLTAPDSNLVFFMTYLAAVC